MHTSHAECIRPLMRGGGTPKCGYNSWLAYVQPLRTLPQVANRSRNTPQPFKNISSSMAFGSHLLVNLTILTLICVIIFALISCVEAALTDSGEGRSLHFFLYNLVLQVSPNLSSTVITNSIHAHVYGRRMEVRSWNEERD